MFWNVYTVESQADVNGWSDNMAWLECIGWMHYDAESSALVAVSGIDAIASDLTGGDPNGSIVYCDDGYGNGGIEFYYVNAHWLDELAIELDEDIDLLSDERRADLESEFGWLEYEPVARIVPDTAPMIVEFERANDVATYYTVTCQPSYGHTFADKLEFKMMGNPANLVRLYSVIEANSRIEQSLVELISASLFLNVITECMNNPTMAHDYVQYNLCSRLDCHLGKPIRVEFRSDLLDDLLVDCTQLD